MEGLPLKNLLPCLLIVGVVDLYDVGHVLLTQFIFLPAPPGDEEVNTAGEKWNLSAVLKLQCVTYWVTQLNSHRNMSFRSVILIESKSKKR